MRDVVTKKRRLSLAGRKPKYIPVISCHEIISELHGEYQQYIPRIVQMVRALYCYGVVWYCSCLPTPFMITALTGTDSSPFY